MTGESHSNTPKKGLVRAWELLERTSERRSLGWRRLAEALYYPTPGWVESLLEGNVGKDLRLSTSWLDSNREIFDPPLELIDKYVIACARAEHAVVLEDLEVEYSRLFIGPSRELPAHPYESVWIDKDPDSGKPIFAGPSMSAVEQTYAIYGLRRVPEHTDMADHIATEMEFMCFLSDNEARAWGSGDVQAAKQLRSSQQQFLSEHLGRFAPQFCDAVAKAASPESPYAGFVEFLLAFLTVETGTPYVEVVTSIWNSPEPPPGAPPAA
jgi:TorA maturation chaperone TorD